MISFGSIVTINAEPDPTGTLVEQLREHMRRVLQGWTKPKISRETRSNVQGLIDRTFERAKSAGLDLSFAEGAVFAGAAFVETDDPSIMSIEWRSAFERHALHKAYELPRDVQPLGHFRGYDLYAWFGGLGGSAVVLACNGPSIYDIDESYNPELLNGDSYTQAALAEGWRRAEVFVQGPQV